jgi:hypothetical protein
VFGGKIEAVRETVDLERDTGLPIAVPPLL